MSLLVLCHSLTWMSTHFHVNIDEINTLTKIRGRVIILVTKITFVTAFLFGGPSVLRLRVKEIAEARGLNRSQLQLKSGVTLPLLNRYWSNNTTEVKLDALEKIARALQVSVGDLFEESQEEEEAA